MNKKQSWKKRLDRGYKKYLKSPVGVFSTNDSNDAKKIGEIIKQYDLRNCLDIGCGGLPLPLYMKINPEVEWYGIDPLLYCQQRQFHFLCGCAEKLPFLNKYFDGVLFASSIDHLLDPITALQEAYRILKLQGYIFVWITEGRKVLLFKQQKKLGFPFDKMHLWGFTSFILTQLLKEQRFFVDAVHSLPSSRETFFVARKMEN